MTIEAILERIAVALERQAEAAPAAEAPPKRGPGRPVGSTKPVEPPAPSVPTAVVPPPAAQPPAPSEDTSFLDDEPAAPVVLTADDVRKALINYGKKPGCSQEKARALLKEHGHVDTLKALKPEHFKAVIDAAGV